LLLAALTLVSPGARAFDATNATALWTSYTNAFYVFNGGNAYFSKSQGSGPDTTDFWFNAEQLEMAVDRATRSGSPGDLALVVSLVNGFDRTYGKDWTGNSYNDDIMWACLAHLRAYQVTGQTNSAWAATAANNFNWVYSGNHVPGRISPQYDSTYGGGMWWTTDHSSTGTKNACVNGPAAIVAFLLSQVYPSGTAYLSDSQNMYLWEKDYLVKSSGFLYDHYATNGAVGSDLSYNAGTCIGAAYYLKDWTTAGQVASYFMNNCCGAGGILPNYGTGGGNNCGFNGIFMRWMALYLTGAGNSAQATYATWLYNNANQAWSIRNSSGLAWDDWGATTPATTQYSWDCSPAVVALQVATVKPFSISTARFNPSGTFQILFSGTSLTSYGLWISSNLKTWVQIGTSTENSPGRYEADDTTFTNSSQRYYQLRWP